MAPLLHNDSIVTYFFKTYLNNKFELVSGILTLVHGVHAYLKFELNKVDSKRMILFTANNAGPVLLGDNQYHSFISTSLTSYIIM